MLYDPKWEQQVEAKPSLLSLAGLIAWLEKKPANGTYHYGDCTNCLLAQYLREAGALDIDSVGPWRFSYFEHRPYLFGLLTRKIRHSEPLPYELNEAAHACTYGGALKNARKLAAVHA